MDQFRKQQTYPLIDTPLEFSQPLQQPKVGSRPSSFELRPLFIPEQNGEANVSAAVPYYRVDGASNLAAFEPLERSEGSSGDAAAAQGASSFQDADLYNDLFVNSRDDRATRPSEDDPALHKAREQLDRNKRAQQRYRLRQKEKLEDYKRQLDGLNQKVEQLLEEKVSLENRTQLLEKVVRMKDERLEYAQQQDVEGAKPYDSSELRRTIYEVQRLVHNGDPGFTLEDLRTIQPAQVEEMHKQTVAFLSLLLTKADAGVAGSETNVLVTRIINGVRAIKNMGAKMQYAHMRKQELSWKHMRVPPADHPAWSKAVASAGLTAEQKRLLLASHSRLLSKMDAIMRERIAIVTAMTSALPQEERLSGSIDDCESSSDSFLQLSQASDALKSSLAKEHRAMLQFYEETQTEHSPLTALQEARILVEIFPHRFEMLWLCSVLGMEGKQRGADPMPYHEMGPPAAGPSLPLTNIMASGPPMHLPGAPSPPATTFVAPRPPSHSGDLPTAGSTGLPTTSFLALGVPVHVPEPPVAGPPGPPPTPLTALGPPVQLPGSPSLPPLFLTAPGGAQESQETYGSPLSGAYDQAHNC